jgi:thiol:disulfide interchange protein DsbD
MNGLSQISNWAAEQLSSTGNPVQACMWLAVGGLLASLLPCVYPLYPITAAIVQNRACDGPRWAHPVTYYGGLVAIYGVLGLAAGVFGGTFNVLLHYAATNLAIGLVLMLLAAATAGLLQLPMFGQRDSSLPPGLRGTWFMGMSAGLMSSACVGPVVVGVLVGLATTTGRPSFSAVSLAGAKMLVFGFGLGLPFLLVGLVGVRLPRSGPWLLWVQRLLAIVLLVFAYGYFVKALETWGIDGGVAERLVWAAAAFLICVVLIQSAEKHSIERRLLRSLYALGLVVSAAILFRGLVGPLGVQTSVAASQFAADPGAPPVEVDGNLTWILDKDAAYAKARQQGKPVFIDFFGAWCTNCKAFQALAKSDAALNAALQKAVLLKVEDTTMQFKNYQSDSRFPELKVGLPFMVITDAEGNLLYKTTDYLRKEDMALFLHE